MTDISRRSFLRASIVAACAAAVPALVTGVTQHRITRDDLILDITYHANRDAHFYNFSATIDDRRYYVGDWVDPRDISDDDVIGDLADRAVALMERTRLQHAA